MKTVLISKNSTTGDEVRRIKNPPYTVFGSPALPQSQRLTMKVGGLRKMIKDLKDEDSFAIEWFAGYKATQYTFFKKAKKK